MALKLKPESVTSREQLAEFVQSFREDLLANPQEWENQTLERFLEAFSRYLEDVPGYLKNVESSVHPEVASWQLFAIALCGARVYE
jgi:hypothetical protein